jgi:HSP20 family protein
MGLLSLDLFGDPVRQIERMGAQLASGRRLALAAPADVWKDEAGYRVALDLPGVDPSSIEVTTERSTLTVKAERRPLYASASEVLVAERALGSFTRQFTLGETLDSGAVSASYADGVLELVVPVAKSQQARRVEVTRAGARTGGVTAVEATRVDPGTASIEGAQDAPVEALSAPAEQAPGQEQHAST